MKAEIKQIQGLALAGKTDSGHWIPMNSSVEVGGSNAGARPLELVLLGLGGCTSMDVISILKKKRVLFTHYECHLEAECAAQDPKVFTRIHIEFLLYGDNINSQAVERAIELSVTRYCSVLAMLNKSAEITTGFKINPVHPS